MKGSIPLLEYTHEFHLLLTMIMITSLEINSVERRQTGKYSRLLGTRKKKKIVPIVLSISLSFRNNTVLNMKHKQQPVPHRTPTFFDSEELSPKPNTMCCIRIKTASATLYAYRFYSCILRPNSQFLAAKKAYVTVL